jgi:hypothetical protein
MYIYGPALEATAPSVFIVWLRAPSNASCLQERNDANMSHRWWFLSMECRKPLRGCWEEWDFIDVTVLEEKEDYDSLSYCMSQSAMHIFKGGKKWKILLQNDKNIFDGQWDEIQGIFLSLGRHFPVYQFFM